MNNEAYLSSRRPFTTAEALRAGWGEGELQRAIRDGRLLRLRRGVLVSAEVHRVLRGAELHRLEVEAQQLALGSPVVASHASAAALLGLPLLQQPALVELTSSVAEPRRRAGLVLRRSPLPEGHTALDASGVPVTSGARTVIDVARTRPFREALVVADAALYRRVATGAELALLLDDMRMWPGAPQARRVCSLADVGAESPGETLMRIDLLELGFTRVVLQQQVRGESGRRYRADAVLPELGVILEFDGRVKYQVDGSSALIAEKRREDDLRLAGWAVVRVTWDELGQLELLRRRIRQAALVSRRGAAAS